MCPPRPAPNHPLPFAPFTRSATTLMPVFACTFATWFMPYFRLHVSPRRSCGPSPAYFAPCANGLLDLVFGGYAFAGHKLRLAAFSGSGSPQLHGLHISPTARHSRRPAPHSGAVRPQLRWLHTVTALRASGGFATPDSLQAGACQCVHGGGVGGIFGCVVGVRCSYLYW